MQKKSVLLGKAPRAAKLPTHEEVIRLARNIRLLILDVDGVMTDGGIVLDGQGNELKVFHVRDGHGIKLLMRRGVEVALITGRESKAVAARAKELGIRHVFQKSLRKLDPYTQLKEQLGIDDAEIAYVGDDVVDIPVMRRVAFSVAVSDADPNVLRFAHYVTVAGGGKGAVREVCELILRAQGHWEGIMDGYTEA